MQRRRTIIRVLRAALTSWVVLAVAAAWAQDRMTIDAPTQVEPLVRPTDATTLLDVFVPSTVPSMPAPPLASPASYESPLQSIYVNTHVVELARTDATGTYAVAGRTTTVLSGDDLDNGLRPGLHVLFGWRLGDFYALETSFLGLFSWDQRVNAFNRDANGVFFTSGNLFSPFTNFGSPAEIGLDYNRLVSVASQTEFDQFEFNLRRRFDLPNPRYQGAGILGLRYLDLSDRLAYRSESLLPWPEGSAVAYDVAAHNRMLGAQIGGEFETRLASQAWVTLEAKGMLFSNATSQSSHFASGPPGAAATRYAAGSHSQRRECLGADLSAAFSWRFVPNVVGRVGYQAIFLDGVALGDDNFQGNAGIAPSGPSHLANDGHLTFHGPFAGLTATW
jgi:hypothetical protein